MINKLLISSLKSLLYVGISVSPKEPNKISFVKS